MILRAHTVVVASSAIANILAAFQLADEARMDRFLMVQDLLPHATEDDVLAAMRALKLGATVH